MSKDGDFSEASYVFGIMSIVFGILQPIFGLCFGITGLILAAKNPSQFAKRAKKLSLAGVVISILIMLALVVGSSYLISKGILPSNLK